MNGRRIAALAYVALLGSCRPDADEQTAESAESLRLARADSVAQAEAVYDAAAFDTVAWPSQEARIERGRVVWNFSCQKCHGEWGHGDGELAREHEIDMPDLTVADWEYEGDVPAIRHRIFVGHESEMPNWGLHGLGPRDIDAVATWIVEGVRSPGATGR